MDQVRCTALPFRTAFRSLTGRASSSDGGSGIPGVPQPASKATAANANPNFDFLNFICSGKE
jgi:hypothetical protein